MIEESGGLGKSETQNGVDKAMWVWGMNKEEGGADEEEGCADSEEFNDCDAGSAEAYVFLVEIGNRRHGGEMLANECLENACACAVEDLDSGGAGHAGVIYEICECLNGFVASHATDIKLLTEMERGIAYVFLCL